MINDAELKKHFGKGWTYYHAINLRDRPVDGPCKRQDSIDWARIEIIKTNAVIQALKDAKAGKSYVEHFERAKAILEELAR